MIPAVTCLYNRWFNPPPPIKQETPQPPPTVPVDVPPPESPFKAIPLNEWNELPEDIKSQFLQNSEVVTKLFIQVFWKDVRDWPPTEREQVISHYGQIEKMNHLDIHINSILRVFQSTRVFENINGPSLENMLALDPDVLRSAICMPGPERMLRCLQHGIPWDSMIKLEPEARQVLLTNGNHVIELKAKNITWEQLFELKPEMRMCVLKNISHILNWLDLGVSWQEITEDITPLPSLLEAPHRTNMLLSYTAWKNIAGLESTLRGRVLKNARIICQMMQEKQMSWEDSLKTVTDIS